MGYEEAGRETCLSTPPACSRSLEEEHELGREHKATGLDRVVGLRILRRTGAIVFWRSPIVLRDSATCEDGVALLAHDDVVLEEMLDSEWRSLPFAYALVVNVGGSGASVRAWPF